MKTRTGRGYESAAGILPLVLAVSLLTIPAFAAHDLIDDTSFVTRNTFDWSMVQSGWNFDNRGGPPKLTDAGPYELNDVSNAFGTRLVRSINAQAGGKMTLESKFNLVSGSDGLYYEFTSTSGATAYKLFTDNGAFNVNHGGTTEQLGLAAATGVYSVKVILDLETATSQTVINNVSFGTHHFAGPVSDIKQLILGTTAKDVLRVIPSSVTLTADYAVHERFTQVNTGSMPYDWTGTGSDSYGCYLTATATTSEACVDNNEMKLALTGTGSAAVQKTFDALSGKVCFETLFFLPAQVNGAEFRLLSGTNTVISVKTLNNKIVAGTSEVRSYYRTNMWYRLRIEADTDTDTAVIKINGKNLGTVPFENAVTSLNGVAAFLMGPGNACLRFDDVRIYTLSEPADYVAEPVVPAKTTDSIIGINVCSLWRNGEHNGWDNISPFDEVKPVLGYYDDFTPEVADWEIKFMAEHGIDYGAFCWYSSQANAPIKTTKLAGALVDGYMNARYSDQIKFSLLWEASNGAHPASSAAFRNYFVPYWVENFFTDDRYMVIENKPVITVFGWYSLIKDFGSEANVAAELNHVRSVCQELGFDGAIFIACNSATATSTLQSIKNCGFDAIQAYNWRKAGSGPAYTQNAINAQYNAGIIHVVPTLSTGFNNVGWGGERSDNMTVPDFSTMLTWIRDTALPRNNTADWRSRLMMLSTWNEYGEGTYIMPSGLNGFGYLDAIRSVFTENPAHTDSIPTASQKARLGYLYPQDRAIIRPLKIENANNYPQDILQSWNFVSNGSVSTGWNYSSMSAPVVAGCAITATATTTDPLIKMKTDANLAIPARSYIKIRAKSYVGDTLQVFFTTAADTTWNAANAMSCSVTSSNMTDYVLPMYTKSGWTGTLKKLRIDPLTSTNSFAIESVSLLYTKNPTIVRVDGTAVPLWCNPVVQDTHTMIPMNPDTGVHYYFKAYFEWDKASGVLKMFANNQSIVFTMGSSTASVNGVPTALGCRPYLNDGIPMVPVDALVKAFGYDATYGSRTIDITGGQP